MGKRRSELSIAEVAAEIGASASWVSKHVSPTERTQAGIARIQASDLMRECVECGAPGVYRCPACHASLKSIPRSERLTASGAAHLLGRSISWVRQQVTATMRTRAWAAEMAQKLAEQDRRMSLKEVADALGITTPRACQITTPEQRTPEYIAELAKTRPARVRNNPPLRQAARELGHHMYWLQERQKRGLVPRPLTPEAWEAFKVSYMATKKGKHNG